MQLMNTAVPETADLLSSACVCVCAINFLIFLVTMLFSIIDV